jgi:hypothetical protein
LEVVLYRSCSSQEQELGDSDADDCNKNKISSRESMHLHVEFLVSDLWKL